MQNTQAFIYKAKQKSNEYHLFFYLSAESDEDAEVERDYLFMKSKYNKSDFFSPIRIDFPVVDDLPLERTFSETFLLSWALEGKAGKTCVPRNTLDVSIAFPELYPYMTKSEQQSDDAVAIQESSISKSIELSPSNESDQPSHSQEPRAYFAKMSQDTRGVAVLMHGFDVIDTVLTKGQMREVITISLDKENHYYSTMLDALRLPAVSIKGPEQFAAFVAGVGRRFEPGDKDATLINVRNYVEQLLAGNEFPSTDASEPQEINYETLSMHTMLSVMNVHPSEAKPSDVRNAKEMMEQRDPIWCGLDKTFRVIVGIRNVDIDTRHAIISEGLKNLKMLNDDSERLHFVKSYLAGHPACPELADYGQDTTAIDEGENESERLAWICNITQKALLGETDVMSKSDIAELMVSVGEDLSPKYMARFLSKEIDVCDPFKQLTEEDIPHLICDVLENWCNEKEPRIAFINERVEFYLKDERNAVSALFENSKLAEVDGSVSTDLPNDADLSTEQAVSEVVNPGAETATEVITTDVATTAPTEPVVSTKPYFEPGRYENIPNDVYHAANGISSTMLKDARISLMYYHGRHVIKSIERERSDALTFGSLVHTLALEPEKLAGDFNIEPIIPEGAFTGAASMRAFIDKHNANLPKMTDSDVLRSILDEHNAKLQTQYALGGNADEIGRIYTLLPPEFQSIQEGQKFTATAMKACIKEYNATLPEPLKTSGGRDALLEQLAIIDLEFATLEKAIPAPLPVSGTKEDMANRIKTILPDAIFADEIIDAWTSSNDGRQLITQQQMKAATAIQRALFTHPSAGPILQHQNRAVEISYFGIDEDTGLDVRVRPDLEIGLDNLRLGVDLKSTSMGKIKQDFLRAKLHREIIDRDYHLSAAMYCDVAALDQFFWIFVNKDENYHWVAIVEASPDLLELGRLEYKKALRDIKHSFDTENWPAPITEEIIDDLNDFDLRRLESLRMV